MPVLASAPTLGNHGTKGMVARPIGASTINDVRPNACAFMPGVPSAPGEIATPSQTPKRRRCGMRYVVVPRRRRAGQVTHKDISFTSNYILLFSFTFSRAASTTRFFTSDFSACRCQ